MNIKALISNPKGHQHLKMRESRGASKEIKRNGTEVYRKPHFGVWVL